MEGIRVSDQSAGPGWWMASDGRWYPPPMPGWPQGGNDTSDPPSRGGPGSQGRMARSWRWYRSRSTRVQWALGGLAVFMALAALGSLVDEPEDETKVSATGSSRVEDDLPRAVTTIVEPTTTTRRPEATTTTLPPTTTSAAPTTTAPPPPSPTAPPATAPPTTAPPPPPPTTIAAPQPAASGCDPNYSGCVPVASDVDCAGGSGNGPAYVSGPVEITGADPYDLDADGDGLGCED